MASGRCRILNPESPELPAGAAAAPPFPAAATEANDLDESLEVIVLELILKRKKEKDDTGDIFSFV